MNFLKRFKKKKYERWYPSCGSDTKMARAKNKVLSIIESLPEDEQIVFIQILRNQLEDLL